IVQGRDLALPGLGALRLGEAPGFYWLALSVVLLCLGAAWRFTRTPLGNAVVLMRENDERAAFLGYNVYATKLIVFTVAATLAAVAGALFAAFQGLVSPSALDLQTSTVVVFMAVLGGTGTFLGPFFGAALYIFFQDWLSKTPENWPFFIGLAVVLRVLSRIARLGIGRSFQIINTFPRLSVYQNVRSAIVCRRRSLDAWSILDRDAGAARETGAVLDLLELAARRDTPASALSYGEQRELEIALTIAARPDLVMLDEPTAGLNSAETRKAIGLIRPGTEGSEPRVT